MSKLEQELKIPVVALAPVRARLEAVGARRSAAPELEENWVLDDGETTLRHAGRLLRVRSVGGSARLTHKGPARFSGRVKEREELEIEIGSAETTLELLGRLGFTPIRRYQKRRETWEIGGVEVALDETPMGPFVELEGDADALEGLACEIGLDPNVAVRGSYLALWEAYRRDHPGVGEDMVFE